jgi:hypothetical protein
MRWTYIIQQKTRLILLLTSLIILIGVTNYIEQRNINQIDQSFNSIYYDRLVPATELLHMTQNLYKQQMLLETAVLSEQPDLRNLHQSLADLNRNTEQRIVNFEKTFLVKHESFALSNFKRGMHEYAAIEEEIIDKLEDGHAEEALAIYSERLSDKFSKTLRKLEDLSSIQTAVGRDILEQSKTTVSYSNLVLTLQIVAAILIGVMTHGLIIASRMTDVNAGKFHLN